MIFADMIYFYNHHKCYVEIDQIIRFFAIHIRLQRVYASAYLFKHSKSSYSLICKTRAKKISAHAHLYYIIEIISDGVMAYTCFMLCAGYRSTDDVHTDLFIIFWKWKGESTYYTGNMLCVGYFCLLLF